MPEATHPDLELDDIQAGALFERPSPYVGKYLMLRIADRADGRELVRRLHRVASSSRTSDSGNDTSLTVAFTYRVSRRWVSRRRHWTASSRSSVKG